MTDEPILGAARGATVLDARAKGKPKAKPSIPPLPYTWGSAINETHTPTEIVEALLFAGGMSMVYGDSNCGKTFIALDGGCRVALGMEWMGRRTRQGPVVYLAAEAGQSIHNRVLAFKLRHEVEDLQVALVTCPVNLFDAGADTEPLIAMVREIEEQTGAKVRLIIVDTLSRAMAGADENASDGMGALVRNSDRIREKTGAHVMWVHHAGKDLSKGARGHSLLRAAVDTEIEVSRTTEGIAVKVTKQRDAPGGDEFTVKLLPIEIGRSQWGTELTSCTVNAIGPVRTDRTVTPKRIPKGADIALRALRSAIDAFGEPLPVTSAIPPGVKAVSGDRWRRTYYTMDAADTDAGDAADQKRAADARLKRFTRARLALQEAGLVGAHADQYWVFR